MKKAKTKRTFEKSKKKSIDPDEILPEYDFTKARPNKFAARIRPGSAVVVLDPDIAAVFPNAGEVNRVLRALAGVILRNRTARQ